MKSITLNDGRVTLFPDEGKKITNGETYGIEVTIEKGSPISNWYEISEERYNEILELESLTPEEQAELLKLKALAFDIVEGVSE